MEDQEQEEEIPENKNSIPEQEGVANIDFGNEDLVFLCTLFWDFFRIGISNPSGFFNTL